MKQKDRPVYKPYVFAQEATEDTIESVPDTQTTTQESQGYIGYQHGYTINNMKPLTENGKPPRGQQLNQLLKDITSVTQYATVGGTYPLNTEISINTGYPKNAFIITTELMYRSLVDDNNSLNFLLGANNKHWQLVADFNPPPTRVVGSFFYAMRTEKELQGALLCNGSEYNINNFPDLKKYLDKGTIPSIDFNSWDQAYNANNGNVGVFGFSNNRFKVPCIQAGTFLGAANIANGDITNINLGTYYADRIKNITGNASYYGSSSNDNFNSKGSTSINISTHSNNLSNADNASLSNGNRTVNINFDASKTVNTGDRVMPRGIMANLYVVVSEQYYKD